MTSPQDPQNPRNPYDPYDPQAPQGRDLPSYDNNLQNGAAHNPRRDGRGNPSYDSYQQAQSQPSESPYPAGQQSQGMPQYGQYDQNLNGAAPYGQYDSQFAVEDNRKNGAAIWALVFAIIGVLMLISLAFSLFAVIPGIIGLIISLVALSKAKKINGPGRRKGMAVTALILSILVTIVSVVVIGLMVVVGADVVQACEGLNEAQFNECVNDYVTDRFNL